MPYLGFSYKSLISGPIRSGKRSQRNRVNWQIITHFFFLNIALFEIFENNQLHMRISLNVFHFICT